MEKDLRSSLNMCTMLHIVATTLATKCNLPQIGQLGKPRPDDQVQMELEEAMRLRELVAGIPHKSDRCHDNTLEGSKLNSLFLARTKKGYENSVPKFSSP